jgi:hypothetical protein
VIAGDDSVLIAPRNQVLVGRSGEPLGKAILNGGCHERFTTTCDFRPSIFNRLGNITLLSSGDDQCLAAQAQIETERKGIEKIFGTIEPAFALAVIFKVAIPIARFP